MMDETIVLYRPKKQTDLLDNLYSLFKDVGYTNEESDGLALHYVTTLRKSTFTKVDTYNVVITADKKTGDVGLSVNGSELKNRKDIFLKIHQFEYRRSWWLFFSTFIVTRTKC